MFIRITSAIYYVRTNLRNFWNIKAFGIHFTITDFTDYKVKSQTSKTICKGTAFRNCACFKILIFS